MKINLGCGNDVRSGYINIDRLPSNQVPPDIYRQGDISSLDWLTEDNTVNEIIALDCLEYLPTNVIKQALINWAQKLSVGGILKILVPDCHAIAKSFAQGQFSLKEYSQMILGTQEGNDNRLAVIDAATLLSILQEIGLTISLKRYEGVAIYVEAIK
jgi:predicted SAM-dependent methyltransferase